MYFLVNPQNLVVNRTRLSGVSATPPGLVTSANLLGVLSAPSSTSLMKKLNRTGPNIDPWGSTTSYRPPTRLCPADHYPLGLAILPLFKPPHCLLIQPVHQQFLYEDVMEDSVKGLTEVQVDNMQCSPLIYQASHYIIEFYQVGQA